LIRREDEETIQRAPTKDTKTYPQKGKHYAERIISSLRLTKKNDIDRVPLTKKKTQDGLRKVFLGGVDPFAAGRKQSLKRGRVKEREMSGRVQESDLQRLERKKGQQRGKEMFTCKKRRRAE